jgi:hypothetical protein
MPRLSSGAIVGVDFDNTIISYDHLILEAARRRGLVDAGMAANKKVLRDAIRLLPDGETSWQKVQAEIYGPAIGGAELIDGVREFLERCAAAGVQAHIVSHKTEYANYDTTGTNLRDAALAWMESRALFGGALARDNVSFAATREEKLARIAALGCGQFIDDLTEVLDHPDFPPAVEKLLLDRALSRSDPPAGKFSCWRDITDHLFGNG